MSQSRDHASLGNGKEAPHSDLLENELLDAISSADDATAKSIAAPARDVIACKIASIVDGMDGIRRNHNGRYPAHSIDQDGQRRQPAGQRRRPPHQDRSARHRAIFCPG